MDNRAFLKRSPTDAVSASAGCSVGSAIPRQVAPQQSLPPFRGTKEV